MEFINHYEKSLKSMYSVNSVKNNYSFWVHFLLEKCLGMFSYKNLPDNLPASEIEKRLIMDGYCFIFNHKEYGLVTSYGSIYGFDLYYRPTDVTYTQPVLGSGGLKVGKDVEIIYNSQVDIFDRQGLRFMIKKYARLLADVESTFNIKSVNARQVKLPLADNQQSAENFKRTYEQIRLGKFEVINQNNNIFEQVKFLDGTDGSNGETLESLNTAKENLLKSFFREIGVKSNIDKRERAIEVEVNSENQMLLVNTSDFLNERKIGFGKVNNLFNCNIEVELSNEYDIENMLGGVENEYKTV